MRLLLLIILLTCYSGFAQLQINEVCSDNDELLQSSNGEYYDWIEIYNNSDKPVELSDYYLSDDEDDVMKWNFSPGIINPKSFVIVFTDKDEVIVEGEQHADFKIKSKGEILFLSNKNSTIDSLEFGEINEDYTYGRLEENSAIKTYLATPTPRSSNYNSGTIISNHQSGYYTSAFDLKLQAAGGVKIYYTMNGDNPTKESELYTDKVKIEDKYPEYEYINVPTTPDTSAGCIFSWKKIDSAIPRCQVISYKTLDSTGNWGRTYSQSFFFENIHKMPVLSIVTDNQNLFNQDSGIYVPGKYFDPNNPCNSGNYSMRGREWERPVSFAYFKDGQLVTEQNAGMRIHGSGSRVFTEKSFRLYARKEYGINKFPNVFLEDAKVKDFDNFIVRGAVNDYSKTLFKDAVTMEAIRNLDLEQTYIQPVVVYFNGNYWGIHEIRNRFDEDYLASLYDLDEDSIDIVKPVTSGTTWEEKDKKMRKVYDFIVENDLTIDKNYEYIQSVYNIPEIIDYYIAETFFANLDWPGNNMKFWNSNEDKKYRPLFYDLDASWTFKDFNMIEFSTQMEEDNYPNPSSINVILVKLLENNNFRKEFINRALYLIDNDFSYGKLKKILDRYVNEYRYEIKRNIDRWNYPPDENTWNALVFKDLYEFARLRACYYKQHLVNYFNLDSNILCSPTAVDITDDNLFNISPNPATNILRLDGIKSKQISIYNLQGIKLLEVPTFGKNTLEIDISNLSPSLYIIKTDTKTSKFIRID